MHEVTVFTGLQGTRGNCVYRVHEVTVFTGYTRALQGTRGLNRVDELTVFTGYMGD